MHIVMVSGEYPPRWGGMGSVVYHLAGHMAQRGHKVTVITRKHKKMPPTQTGVEVIPVRWAPLPMSFTRSFGKHAIKALKQLDRRRTIDVVNAHLPLVSWSRKQFRFIEENIAPVVSTLHGSWIGEREGVRRASMNREMAIWKNPNDLAIRLTAGWYARYERAGILESTCCVAVSCSTKEEFLEFYKIPEDSDIEVVHNGCDARVFRPPDRDSEREQLAHERLRKEYGCADEEAMNYDPKTKTPLLLAVGRLAARKGYVSLLRALPLILKEHENAKLVIVGRGHMKKKLLSIADELGVRQSLFIQSAMSFEDLAQLYRSADLVVFPSYYEGQGLIPLEALASGTPVVTVDQAPLTEMIDDTVGGLFDRGDFVGLAKAVCDELNGHVKRVKKAKAGRKRVLENFTLEGQAESYEDVFLRSVQKRRWRDS